MDFYKVAFYITLTRFPIQQRNRSTTPMQTMVYTPIIIVKTKIKKINVLVMIRILMTLKFSTDNENNMLVFK